MLKVGFLLSIGMIGCDDRIVVDFKKLESLEDIIGERPAKDYILDYGYDEAKQWAESYGYYEEEVGVFLNHEGDEASLEVSAYMITTAEELESFEDGLDEGIGQQIS